MFPRFVPWILALVLATTAGPVGAQQLPGRSTFETPQVHGRFGSSGQVPLQFTPAVQFGTGGNTPVGVAVGDFNGDGKPDLVVVNAQQNNVAVLLGNGDGTFRTPIVHSLPTIGVPFGVAVADFNGDGKPDVAVIHGSIDYLISDVEILLGNGDGTLGTPMAFPSGTNAVTIVTADLDGDGRPDVIVGGAGGGAGGRTGNLSVLFGNGDGTLQPAISLGVPEYTGGLWSAAVGNFSGHTDGLLDIVAAQVSPMAGIAVFLQNPDRTFTLGATYQTLYVQGVGVAAADLNNDGKLDVVLTSNMGTASAFLGNGDGTFQSPIPTFSGNATELLALADFNRDGFIDVAFADYSAAAGPGVLAAAGLGNGHFSNSNTVTLNTAGGTKVVAVADFNGDGWPDIVTADAAGNKVSVFLNVAGGLQFVPVAPCRLVDTRLSGGPLQGGMPQDFNIPLLGGCDIPVTAAAYSLNVTLVPPPGGTVGFLTVWPTGETMPNASLMNSWDGRYKANAAIVPAGASEQISVYSSNTTNLVLDIDGYFETPGSSGLAFYPLAPCRVADTRGPTGDLGGPYLHAGVERTMPVQSESDCGIPPTAQAYSFNFTTIPRSGPMWVFSAWPDGQSRPTTSTLNAPTGTVVANAAIVPAGGPGTQGAIDVWASNDADLVIDVNGYFAPAGTGGLSLYTIPTCRVRDTRRDGSGPFNGLLSPPVDPNTSPCAVPITAQAFVFNATIVPQGLPVWLLTLWPDDGSQAPNTSTLNAYDAAVTSNMAIVPTTNGSINADAAGLTQLILDISSYFAP